MSGDIWDQETAQYMYQLHHQYEILYWRAQYMIRMWFVMACQNPDCLIADIFSATCTWHRSFLLHLMVCVCDYHKYNCIRKMDIKFPWDQGNYVMNSQYVKRPFVNASLIRCTHAHTFLTFFLGGVSVVEAVYNVQQKPVAQFPDDRFGDQQWASSTNSHRLGVLCSVVKFYSFILDLR